MKNLQRKPAKYEKLTTRAEHPEYLGWAQEASSRSASSPRSWCAAAPPGHHRHRHPHHRHVHCHHYVGQDELLFHLLLLRYQLMFLLYSFNVHADLFHIGLTIQRLNWARRKIPRGKQKKEKTMRRKNDIKEKMTYLLFLLNTSLDLGRTVDGSAGGSKQYHTIRIARQSSWSSNITGTTKCIAKCTSD